MTLGRRVLIRSLQPTACTGGGLNCPGSRMQRVVWDGDQILHEINMPALGGFDVENDTLIPSATSGPDNPDTSTAPELRAPRYFPWWGWTTYTHGGGIDQPLSLIRVGYGTSSGLREPITVIPRYNWRGHADEGTLATGAIARLSSTGEGEINWPARGARAYLGRRATRESESSWFGSLIMQQRDVSGTLYMRNRYYDPATGRFTQEDPIGLAGG